MNYAPAQKISTARHIARSAQRQIKDKTGMRVTLLLYPTENAARTPAQMLKVIALALDMNYECFKMKTRVRDVVELRFIGAMFLRMKLSLCNTTGDSDFFWRARPFFYNKRACKRA